MGVLSFIITDWWRCEEIAGTCTFGAASTVDFRHEPMGSWFKTVFQLPTRMNLQVIRPWDEILDGLVKIMTAISLTFRNKQSTHAPWERSWAGLCDVTQSAFPVTDGCHECRLKTPHPTRPTPPPSLPHTHTLTNTSSRFLTLRYYFSNKTNQVSNLVNTGSSVDQGRYSREFKKGVCREGS